MEIVDGSMEVANKRKAITEFLPIKCKKSKEVPETFTFEEEIINLMAEIRKIPVGAKLRELFLCELLLNADLALNLVRKGSLIDKKKYKDADSLENCIIPDERNKTLSIVDNGIGMTRDELIHNFGSSYPWFEIRKRHMDTLKKYLAYDDAKLNHIYKTDRSKWGLGFFSAYMVADKVVVTTRVQGDDPFVWECNANDNGVSTFSVAAAVPGDDSFVRGTKVTLHLKPGHEQYLRVDKLQELVNKCEKLFHFYPILVFPNGKNEGGGILLNDKKEEPIEKLKEEYEDIRLLFVKYVCENAKNVDVVISDRAKGGFFCVLDVFEDGCKRPVLEINPRCIGEMKFIRKKMLECVESVVQKNKKKNNKEKSASYTKKKELALKRLIIGHFIRSLERIQTYDVLNGTSFHTKAQKAIASSHRWDCWD